MDIPRRIQHLANSADGMACDICGKGFITGTKLRLHKYLDHNMEVQVADKTALVKSNPNEPPVAIATPEPNG